MQSSKTEEFSSHFFVCVGGASVEINFSSILERKRKQQEGEIELKKGKE